MKAKDEKSARKEVEPAIEGASKKENGATKAYATGLLIAYQHLHAFLYSYDYHFQILVLQL